MEHVEQFASLEGSDQERGYYKDSLEISPKCGRDVVGSTYAREESNTEKNEEKKFASRCRIVRDQRRIDSVKRAWRPALHAEFQEKSSGPRYKRPPPRISTVLISGKKKHHYES
jgi:hypothetical protein